MAKYMKRYTRLGLNKLLFLREKKIIISQESWNKTTKIMKKKRTNEENEDGIERYAVCCCYIKSMKVYESIKMIIIILMINYRLKAK